MLIRDRLDLLSVEQRRSTRSEGISEKKRKFSERCVRLLVKVTTVYTWCYEKI